MSERLVSNAVLYYNSVGTYLMFIIGQYSYVQVLVQSEREKQISVLSVTAFRTWRPVLYVHDAQAHTHKCIYIYIYVSKT